MLFSRGLFLCSACSIEPKIEFFAQDARIDSRPDRNWPIHDKFFFFNVLVFQVPSKSLEASSIVRV